MQRRRLYPFCLCWILFASGGCRYLDSYSAPPPPPEAAEPAPEPFGPTLGIRNAPPDARLYINGDDRGRVAQYDGVHHGARVQPGVHHIEVRDAEGKLILDEDVRFGPETRKILLIQQLP